MNKFLIKCMFHIYQWHLKYGFDESECKFKARLTLLITLFAYPAFTYLTLMAIFHFETFMTAKMNLDRDRTNNYTLITIYFVLPFSLIYLTYWLINKKKFNNLWNQYVNGELKLTKKDKIQSRIFYFGVLFIFFSGIAILLFYPPETN